MYICTARKNPAHKLKLYLILHTFHQRLSPQNSCTMLSPMCLAFSSFRLSFVSPSPSHNQALGNHIISFPFLAMFIRHVHPGCYNMLYINMPSYAVTDLSKLTSRLNLHCGLMLFQQNPPQILIVSESKIKLTFYLVLRILFSLGTSTKLKIHILEHCKSEFRRLEYWIRPIFASDLINKSGFACKSLWR